MPACLKGTKPFSLPQNKNLTPIPSSFGPQSVHALTPKGEETPPTQQAHLHVLRQEMRVAGSPVAEILALLVLRNGEVKPHRSPMEVVNRGARHHIRPLPPLHHLRFLLRMDRQGGQVLIEPDNLAVVGLFLLKCLEVARG